MTKEALIQLINDRIHDNDNGEITPERLREVLHELANSNSGGVLEEDITVKGVNVGNLTNGNYLKAGTLITQVFKQMLIKISAPSAGLSTSVSDAEAGTILNATINGSYSQNDGGVITNYKLSKNSTSLIDSSGITPYTETNQIGDNSFIYSATFTYAKSDSIDAGSLTASTSINGRRKAFYGVNTNVTTSAGVRSLSGSILNVGNGSSFTINIPAGSTSVEFSYPANLNNVSKVVHLETNYDVKGVFTLTSVTVEGANNFTSIPYKVYKFIPAAPFSGDQKYTVTI